MPNNKKAIKIADEAASVDKEAETDSPSTGSIATLSTDGKNVDSEDAKKVVEQSAVSEVSAETIAIPDDATEEDPELEAAVTDISRQDSDEVLAAQDKANAAPEEDRSFKARVKRLLAAWWHNRRARWATLAGLVVVILLLAILPPSRSFALNTIGVRGQAKVTVLDATTNLPLKGVTVQLGSIKGQTDVKGIVSLAQVKLGNQQLQVKKAAFAVVNQKVSIGLGQNSLGNFKLKAIGTQYHFTVDDYVSAKPVTTAQAISGEATAVADGKGTIVLTAIDPGANTLTANISAKGYRTAKVQVPIGSAQATAVHLVSSLKTVFISKQTGKYDVYKSDIDGANKSILLTATGNETTANTLVPNPNGEVTALINNRDNQRDSNGYLLQTLTFITVSTGVPTVIDHSERIQPVDWFGDRFVYVIIKAGASAANPSRYQLMSYDFRTNQRLQLDHANSFNDIVSANGSIYYATSNAYNGGVSQFMRINADNSNKQALLVNEVWNIFRVDYGNFHLTAGDNKYTYKLGDDKPATTSQTYNGQSRLYIDSPDGKHSLWVDQRDGKGTLLLHDIASNKDTVLAAETGLNYPVRWLGDGLIIYRISSPKETADYIVSIDGGGSKKIADVTDTTGITLWYYY